MDTYWKKLPWILTGNVTMDTYWKSYNGYLLEKIPWILTGKSYHGYLQGDITMDIYRETLYLLVVAAMDCP